MAVGSAAIITVALLLGGCTTGAPVDGAAGDDGAVTATGGDSGGDRAGAAAGGGAIARTRGEFPTATPAARIRMYAEQRLATMTLEQKIASLFVVHVPGADPGPLQAYLAANAPGGLLLLGDNVPGPAAQAAALTGALHESDGLGTLIAIDEEGGIVARLGDDSFESAATLKNEPVAATTAAFTARAALLASTGMTVNFGIVADVTADPSSFIFERALGTDAAASSERVAAVVTAERGSVFSTLKHFPGHGAAPGDSHSSLPTTDLPAAQWLAQDAPPFRAGIDAGASLVMFGHLVYSAVDSAPASLSAAWHQKLRDELGFDGVTVTDDMLMLENAGVPAYADRVNNAVLALNAGNDLLLYNTQLDLPPLVAAIASAVRAGTIAPATVDEAALRDLTLRRELWVRQQPPVPMAALAEPGTDGATATR
ncbi:glycoside hydrolase family 3 N-terminal domain-containing protein [Herbiconiux sp. 11R-BC]|uniref:glycoside hydrolase family 3 N-terminal domain-containing protein n=1 Tax=Herbiconiux sp. 11R-BC TaxID=3111637 RepID=UPI003C00C368